MVSKPKAVRARRSTTSVDVRELDSRASSNKSVTTVVDVPEPMVERKRAKPLTPQTRSKATTAPKPRLPKLSTRLPLFLLTEPDGVVAGQRLRVGHFENPKPTEIRAYEPNDLAYVMLATRNSRYLHVDRIWPVMINQASGLVRDERKRNWKFKLVQLGEPLLLSSAETWDRLIEGGLRRTPKLKRDPSLLIWPAIKGHVAVIRTLLDRGVPIPADDVVIALLRELRVTSARGDDHDR